VSADTVSWGEARVGISGWRYAPWRGDFYPKGLQQRRELEYASSKLTSIEINGSFYSLQRPSSWLAWAEQTPDDFVFSVKGPRYVTHLLRLRSTDDALANFFASGLFRLGRKLGPILWQLPPNLHFDEAQLDAFLSSLPRTTTEAAALAARSTRGTAPEERGFEPGVERALRHALEVRSDTFDTERYFALLERQGVASVVADTAGKWPFLTRVTADFAYVRLHGDEILYESGYSPESLDTWAARVDGWRATGRDAFVYFDNDIKVRAPYDAMALASRLARTPG
jgi:uncharacterized protein YecE (DUF72 family)